MLTELKVSLKHKSKLTPKLGALLRSRPTEELKANLVWKDEFAATKSGMSTVADVATQEFRETDCYPGTDLVFQLGVMSADQQAHLAGYGKRPQQFVALSIRTDYDPVNLRGKGFIYVSADSGPLRFEGAGLPQAPWGMAKAGSCTKSFSMNSGIYSAYSATASRPIFHLTKNFGAE